MSRERTIKVKCPKCGAEHDFTVYQSVNVTLDPELKDSLIDGSLVFFKCPSCGEETNVIHDLLYHDMEKKLLIQQAASRECAKAAFKMWTTGSLVKFEEQGYQFRIVRTRNDLLEKIAIFDEGLDDRFIEIYKIFVLSDLYEKYPEYKEPEVFHFKEDGKNTLKVLADGEWVGSVDITDETYKNLEEKFAEALKGADSSGPFIDRVWAVDVLEEAFRKRGKKDGVITEGQEDT